MSRYSNYSLASSTKSSNGFNSPTLKSDRHDEHASQSGSEDGSYALYADPHKIEADFEESNAALTSQTLNADGTPKRPMNAFMIFARRRRPQVSAENQAMRTGEISKILSKEWVSMPSSEKQFYLEQAKQLKETFNSRYPDYVYRRRPNNSRKRRRSDSGTMRPVDPALLADQGDDLVGSVDLEASPTESDDPIEAALPSPYSRQHSQYGIPQSCVDQTKYGHSHPRPAHQVSSEPLFRSNGHYETRLQYGGSDRLGPNLGGTASPRIPVTHGGLHYPYGHPPSHSQSPTIFGTDPGNSPQGWQTRVERVERATTSWIGGGQDRVPSSIASQKQSPYSSASSWSSSNENSSVPSSASPSSPNYFPTLNTPFYPNQQVSPFQSNVSTPSPHSVPHHSPSFESLNHLQSSSMSRDFTPRGYETSSVSSASSYPVTRDSASYSQRSLPPVQTGSAYPQPSSSSSAHGHPPPGFWSRA
ncbi:hypothetical protein GALMADRAFT_251818 [Galerina marginata CBS 339.88]|uniref:HMG box domain-containing protein n=1 Tax=Galerina marginata (strain CBS 339.88) TaxID=685588 RepID=A0A067SZW4_GALM3|nr:hypothetical protein GALMADRAFT_251818 [Galerina marginata CBS 339.88]